MFLIFFFFSFSFSLGAVIKIIKTLRIMGYLNQTSEEGTESQSCGGFFTFHLFLFLFLFLYFYFFMMVSFIFGTFNSLGSLSTYSGQNYSQLSQQALRV
jgi:glycosyltransferase involved in cell wall biosynthesis